MKKFSDIKIFGERNTGTNALKILVESNSKSKVVPSVFREINSLNNFCGPIVSRMPFYLREILIDSSFKKKEHRYLWKHSATNKNPALIDKNLLYLFCVRHPVSWCLSLYKNSYHIRNKNKKFYDFLIQNIDLLNRDNVSFNEKINPVQLWNIKIKSYIDLSRLLEKNSYNFIKFEDFIDDQSFVFNSISEKLINPNKNIQLVKKSTKNKSKDYKYYKNYYNNELWRNEVSKEELIIIKKYLSKNISSFFGYEIID